MSSNYTARLEEVVKQFIRPLRNVPFNLVIEALSGHKVLAFDEQDDYDKRLLDALRKAAVSAGEAINKTGILSARADEVGNYIEPKVKEAMNALGLGADTPRCASGKRKASGYPDIEFTFEGRAHYAECKTYNAKNFATTQRSFYLSPSSEPKVCHDAHHFLISYEFSVTQSGTKNLYKCRHWRIISLDALSVDLKFEFNSDNFRLYGNQAGAKTLDHGAL
jgi:hypothetical protein